MHTYEIYLTSSSCDEEWDYLGKIQANSEIVALYEARQRWPEYPPDELIALDGAVVASGIQGEPVSS